MQVQSDFTRLGLEDGSQKEKTLQRDEVEFFVHRFQLLVLDKGKFQRHGDGCYSTEPGLRSSGTLTTNWDWRGCRHPRKGLLLCPSGYE